MACAGQFERSPLPPARRALWPPAVGRQAICALAAAYFAWIGIGYFAWLSPGIGLSGAWGLCSALQAVLLVLAGILRSDYGMIVAAVITTGLIIWRYRASGPAWHTVTAGCCSP